MTITVPEYQQTARPAPLPDARRSTAGLTPDQFGGGIAEGLAKVADQAFAIHQNEQQKANQVAVLDADVKLSGYATTALYDPQSGALNKHGKDAFGLPEQVMGSFDKQAATIEQGLTNDEQRLAFRRMAASRRIELGQAVERHVSGEIKQYDDTTTQSYIANARNDAALNYQDPQRVGLEVERQRAAITDYAQRNGMPDEWLKQKVADATSQTHIAVLDRMLANNQDLQAKQYFDAVKPEIGGDAIAKVEKAVEAGTLRGESQRQADGIVAANPDPVAAMEAARKIQDPQVRDATAQRVSDYFGAKKQAEAQQRADAYLQADKVIEGNGGNLNAISPTLLVNLEPAQRNALETRSRQIRQGVEPAQSDKTWLQFLDQNPADLGKLTQADMLSKYRPYLDNEHWNRATALWSAAAGGAKGGTASTEHLTPALSFKDRVDNAFKASGIVDANKSKAKFNADEAKAYAGFETQAARELEHYELTQLGGKRKATGEEQQQLIDGLLMRKVFVDRTLRTDPELPTAMLTDEQRGRTYVPIAKIPTADRNAVENLIRAKGARISQDKVQRAYAQYLIGDRVAFDQVIGE